MANKFNLRIGTSIDKKAIEELKKEFIDIQNVLEQYKQKTGSMNTEMQTVLKTSTAVSKALESSFNKDLGTVNINKFNESLKKSGTTITQVQKAFTSCGSVGAKAWADLSSKILSANKDIYALKESTSQLDNIFKTAFQWNLGASVFNAFKREISEAYDYVLQLDQSLNNIRIVTGYGAEEMASFAVEANKAAKSLGASTLDYTNATLIYAQQGLEGAARDERARITTEVANIEKESTDKVAEELTAIWNGFQISADQVEKTIDKLSKVAATTASDMGSLTEGMSQVAASANATGLDIDTLNGALASLIDVTQMSASRAGNSIKSILTRMGDLAIDPKSTDEFGVSLGDIAQKMKALGVEILDENGKLKEMTQVWEEFGERWSTWDKSQKQAAAIAVAGRYQYNSMMTIFDNWDRVLKTREESINSQGTLQEQQDIYMESTEAHLKQLQASAEKVYQTVLEASSINKVADSISSVIDLVGNFEEGLGGGLYSLINFGSAISMLFSKQIGEGIVNTLSKVQQLKTEISNDSFAKQLSNLINQKEDLLRQSASEGSNADNTHAQASLNALSKQKAMYEEMYEYRRFLTDEEKQGLLTNQSKVYELEKERSLLEAQTKVHTNIENEYQNMITSLGVIEQKVEEINSLNQLISDGELTVREGLQREAQIRQEISAEIQENALLSKTSLMENLDNNYKMLDLNKAEEEANRTIVTLYQQQGMSQKDVELLQTKIAQGKEQELSSEIKILQQEQQIVLQEKQKIATTQKWIQGLSLATSALAVMSHSISTMLDKSSSMSDKINSWGSSITQLSGMVTSFGLSTGNIAMAAIGGGISLISSVLTPVISDWAKGEQESIETLEQKITDFRQTSDTTLSNISTLESLKGEYEQLSKGVDAFGQNISLTSASYERYQEIVSQVIGMSDDVVLGYDNEGKAIYEANGLIQQQIDLLKEKLELEKMAVYTDDSVKKKSKGDYNKYQENQKAFKEAEDAKNKLLGVNKDSAEFIGKLKDGINTITQETINAQGLAVDEILESKSEAYQELYAKLNSGNSLGDVFQHMMHLTPQQRQQIANDLPEESREVFTESFNKMKDYYDQTLIDFKYHKGIAEQKVADSNYLIGLFQSSYTETYDAISKLGNGEGLTLMEAYANALDFSEDNSSYNDLARKIEEYSQDLIKLFNNPELFAKIKSFQQDFKGSYSELQNELISFLNDKKEYFLKENGEWNKELLQSIFGLENFDVDEKTDKIKQIFSKIDNEIENALQEIGNKKTKGLSSDLIKKIFSEEEINDSLSEILETLNWKKLEDGAITAEQALRQVKKSMDFKEESSQVQKDLEDLSTALDKIEEGKNFTKDDEDFFASLESRYTELQEYGERTSEDYINALRRIRQEEAGNYGSSLLQEAEELENKLSSIDIKVNPEEYYQTLEELQNKEIQIDLAFHAEVGDSIEDAYGLAEAYQNVAEVITKDFQISFEQAKQFASEGMGEILVNAKTTGEGMLQLDTDIVANYVQNRQSELDVSKRQKIAELTDEKTVLQKKKEILVNKLTALQNAAKAETTTEKAKYLTQATMYQLDYEAYSKQVIAKANSAEEGNVEISEDAKRLTDFLGGNAETQASNQMQAVEDADTSYAQGVNNAIDYYNQLNLKLQEVARNIQEAAKGGTVTNSVGHTGKKGVNTTASSAQKNNDTLEKTANEDIIKNDYKAVEDLINKINTDELDAVINNSIGQTRDSISQIDSEIGSIDSAISLLNGSSEDLSKNIKKNKSLMDKYGTTSPSKSQLNGDKKKKSKPKKTNDKAKKQAEKEKKKKASQDKKKEKNEIEVETDLYHDLDIALEKVTSRYEDLERAREKVYGKSYLNILKNEKLNLEKQESLEKLKLKSINSQLKRGKTSLKSKYGISFNKQGDIQNYNEELIKWQNYFNKKMAKDPDNADLYKQRFEKFKKKMESYETLLYKTKRETIDAIEEAQDKIYELQLEEFTYKVEVKLDTSEVKKQWLEFCLELSDLNYEFNIRDNIIQTVRNSINQAKTLVAKDGALKTLSTAINGVINSKTISKADKQDLLTKYSQDLQEAYKDLKTLENEIRQGYIDALDEADSRFSEHLDKYDQLSEKLQHNKDIVKMLYGEESFSLLDQIYSAQHKNNLGQLDMLSKEVKYWESMTGKFKKGTEEWENWNKKLTESTQNLQSAIESSIENLQEAYENMIDSTLDMFTRALAGGNFTDLSYIGEQWNMAQEQSEKYLDTLESIQGIESFISKIQQEIEKTDDLSLKQKLTDLQKEELENLTKKDKLSQYDLDRAEARYNILIKENELEEARNAKNSMKRVRDSQGNWTFNYVASEEGISDKAEEMREAQNSLYKLDKDKYSENLSDLYSIYSEWQDKIKELYLNSNLTAEELEIRKKDYAEYYGEMINDIVRDNENIKNNLYSSTFDTLADLYQKDEKQTTQWLKKITGVSYSSWNEIENHSVSIMHSMNSGFETTIQDMIDKINGEGGFESIIKNTYGYLDKANRDYLTGIEEIEQKSGEKFSNVRENISEVTNETNTLIKKNDTLIKTYEDLQLSLDNLYSKFDSYKDKWKALEDSSLSALKAAKEYLELLGDLSSKESSPKKATSTTKKESAKKETKDKTETPKTKKGKATSTQGNGKIEKGDQVTLKTVPYYYRSDGTGGKGTKHKGEKLYITNINTSGAFPYHLSLGKTLGNGDLGWVKKSQISGFDTGGITGNWAGDQGKLAILHKKEIVLNKNETKDFLAAIQTLRGIKDFISPNFLGKISTNNSNTIQNNMSDEKIYIQNLTVKAENVDDFMKEIKNIALIAKQK